MAKEKKGVTRALSLEIMRPVAIIERGQSTPVGWPEIGPTLNALRAFAHRAQNAAVLMAIEANRRNRNLPKTDPGWQHPKSAAYQAIPPELEEFKSWASQVLKTKKTDEDVRSLTVMAGLTLPSGIQTALANKGFDGMKKWQKNKANERIPSWKKGAAIPVPKLDCDLVHIDGKLYLDVRLLTKGRVRFLVTLGKGGQWDVGKAIARGDLPHGEVKLVLDERKSNTWFGRMPHTRPTPEVPAQCDPNNVLVLHRGWYNFLYALSTTGHSVALAGKKLLDQKTRIGARRKAILSVGRAERGKGAKGHGRKRYHAFPNNLADLEARIVKTACQTTAARIVELALHWKCGRIVIENYGGMLEHDERYARRGIPHPPYYDLKLTVQQALEKVGLTLEEYDCYYISQTCPACLSRSADYANRRRCIFRCGSCGYTRPLDLVAALNALSHVNGGTLGEVWEDRMALQRFFGTKARAKEGEKDVTDGNLPARSHVQGEEH